VGKKQGSTPPDLGDTCIRNDVMNATGGEERKYNAEKEKLLDLAENLRSVSNRILSNLVLIQSLLTFTQNPHASCKTAEARNRHGSCTYLRGGKLGGPHQAQKDGILPLPLPVLVLVLSWLPSPSSTRPNPNLPNSV